MYIEPAADPTGGKTLGEQIADRYVNRAFDGILVIPQIRTMWENHSGYYHQFQDDGLVAVSSEDARREFFVHFAKSLGVKENGKWWTIKTNDWRSVFPFAKERFTVKEVTGVAKLAQASFWLGGMHDFQANGTYMIRLYPIKSKPGVVKVEIKKVDMRWRWVDEIDARSWWPEYNWKKDNRVQGGIEGAVDTIVDKGLDANFLIHVNFQETDSQELMILPAGNIVEYSDIPWE